MRIHALLLLLIGATLTAPCHSAEDGTLDEIQVADLRGPPIWRVSKDDHVLWIAASYSPVPADLQWHTREIETLAAEADEVLSGAGVIAVPTHGVIRTAFTVLRLLPSLMALRDNPDDRTLRDLLPPDVHARWLSLAGRYFEDKPEKFERWRPMFVADALVDRAMMELKLTRRDPVSPVLNKAARAAGTPQRSRNFVLPLDNPRAMIKAFRELPAGPEIDCLVATFDYIEHELPHAAQRARAWAVSDLASLNPEPAAAPHLDCIEYVLERAPEQSMFRALYDEQKSKIEAEWQGAAGYALLRNPVTVTTLPLEMLLDPGGPLEQLRASGYRIEAPL